MDFTVLQPARFMQNLSAMWPEVAEHGRLTLPHPASAAFCWVDHRDVAEVVALAMPASSVHELASRG